MAKAGAPVGNKNGAKSTPWSDALRRALAREAGSVPIGLDKIATAVVNAAINENDKDARKEIWERLEGKVADRVNIGDADGLPMQSLVQVYLPANGR